jgi:hypothetical protein
LTSAALFQWHTATPTCTISTLLAIADGHVLNHGRGQWTANNTIYDITIHGIVIIIIVVVIIIIIAFVVIAVHAAMTAQTGRTGASGGHCRGNAADIGRAAKWIHDSLSSFFFYRDASLPLCLRTNTHTSLSSLARASASLSCCCCVPLSRYSPLSHPHRDYVE